ncbi:hypothetical protein AAFF_G00360670 [Aldrovandia affinis]|uniref:Uncharacterized protein n=1 Tax=Aldrovandia affinis TaxID=143900 RepID=A0AAD7WN48_9TELE|nr:hypothetical protein AAFF_G00360670 [Aldrovandia affinis]
MEATACFQRWDEEQVQLQRSLPLTSQGPRSRDHPGLSLEPSRPSAHLPRSRSRWAEQLAPGSWLATSSQLAVGENVLAQLKGSYKEPRGKGKPSRWPVGECPTTDAPAKRHLMPGNTSRLNTVSPAERTPPALTCLPVRAATCLMK